MIRIRAAHRLLASACLALSLGIGAVGVRVASAEEESGGLTAPRLAGASSVTAGQTVEITWTLPDAPVEEMELLLSIDGGRHFAVRVSPSIEAPGHRFAWRVPNLPCAEARLVLRARIEGREIESPASERFAIVGDPDAEANVEVVHEDGWWSGLDAAPDGDLPAFEPGGRAEWVAGHGAWSADDAPRAALAPPALGRGSRLDDADALSGPDARLDRSPARRATPLRN